MTLTDSPGRPTSGSRCIVLLFYLADVVPRAFYRQPRLRQLLRVVKEYTKERWTRSRIALVVVGLSSFYVVYVAYRNLKGFLPFVRDDKLYDPC